VQMLEGLSATFYSLMMLLYLISNPFILLRKQNFNLIYTQHSEALYSCSISGTDATETFKQGKYLLHFFPCYAVEVISIFSFAVSDVIH